MERVVMPILEDFKPDLIINSAGQDNHFTDPITNMNFSAKGYAALNEMLKPDIAVLEGGYSIQGALPYINLGICLAMAGVDYSHIREPNYKPEQIKQSAQTTEYIAELCKQLPKLYFDPPAFDAKGDSRQGVISGDMFIRHKQIYYDTDGINEVQQESLIMCDKCRGLYKVETRADSGPLCLGVEIPIDACPDCKSKGYQIVEDGLLKGNYRYVQLINRLDKDYVRYGF